MGEIIVFVCEVTFYTNHMNLSSPITIIRSIITSKLRNYRLPKFDWQPVTQKDSKQFWLIAYGITKYFSKASV